MKDLKNKKQLKIEGGVGLISPGVLLNTYHSWIFTLSVCISNYIMTRKKFFWAPVAILNGNCKCKVLGTAKEYVCDAMFVLFITCEN